MKIKNRAFRGMDGKVEVVETECEVLPIEEGKKKDEALLKKAKIVKEKFKR